MEHFNQMKQMLEFMKIDLSGSQEVKVENGAEELFSDFQWDSVAIKSCFNNAARLCLSCSNVSYCIGYAFSLLPMEHAWISYNGTHYDPTWEKYSEIGKSYMLLKTFTHSELLDFLDRSQNYPPDLQNLVNLNYLKIRKQEDCNQK